MFYINCPIYLNVKHAVVENYSKILLSPSSLPGPSWPFWARQGQVAQYPIKIKCK